MLIDSGSTRRSVSNAFGYYTFDHVTSGRTYVLTATAKRFTFTPHAISVQDDLHNADLTALW
ncbi:MAG: hypothetical protein ACJ73D_06435 [Pyrinomonadaceae bacterium]